jgi:DHA2 family multidrug resistance protein
VLVGLLILGLPHQRSHLDRLREADWLGIAGLALGLGGLTVLLEEGQRELWFESNVIRLMALVSAFGFGLLGLGQVTARRPVIKLRLLRDRQFGSTALMGIVLGIVLYGTSYAIPQFLSAVAGYNALQSGKVVVLVGIPSMVMMAIVPFLLRKVDVRIAVAVGLAIMAGSSFLDADLTTDSSGAAFTASQLMRGVGQILGMLFLSQSVVRSVPRIDAGDASGLFSAMRNLGGSFALAGIAIIQDQRLYFHARRLEEQLPANSLAVQEYVHAHGPLAIATLEQSIQAQALVMTFNDIFRIMGLGTLVVLPLVLFLRPFPKDAPVAPVH